MKTETLASVRNNLSKVLDAMGDEPIFITRNGKIAAVLQSIRDDDVEDYLMRNSPAFWKLIEARRAKAGQGEVIPFDPARYDRPQHTAMVREPKPKYGGKKKG